MEKDIHTDLGKSLLGNQDLLSFYKTLPYRVITNDENSDLDSGFLHFVYGLIDSLDMCYTNDMIINIDDLLSILENYKDLTYESNIYFGIESDENEDDLLFDIQGLKWKNQLHRDELLQLRQSKYDSFTNIPHSKEMAKNDVNVELDIDMDCWNFKQFFKLPKPKLSHFQLRNNLICLNNKKEVFYNEMTKYRSPYLGNSIVKKINTFNGEISTVLDLKSDTMERVSTIDCNEDLLLVGTMAGSYHIKNLKTNEVDRKIVSTSPNGIINFNKILDDTILFSTNDGFLINTDLNNLKIINKVQFPWAINSISMCPFNDKIKLIVGDNINSFIIDERISYNRPVNILRGHKDFAFCCDWSNNGLDLATGNQDSTVRLYDIRSLKENKFCIKGENDCSVGTVGFNQTNDSLVFSETIDSVNIVDLNSLRNGHIGSKQVISLFGHVIGSKFTNFDNEDGELLTIGINDSSIGGILQYELESTTKCMEYEFV